MEKPWWKGCSNEKNSYRSNNTRWKSYGNRVSVEPDIVMTVKHNVVTADELITDEFEEKEIMFRMEVGDEVVGKTINLLEAIKKGIDCPFPSQHQSHFLIRLQIVHGLLK